jgi:hypothetical protein
VFMTHVLDDRFLAQVKEIFLFHIFHVSILSSTCHVKTFRSMTISLIQRSDDCN